MIITFDKAELLKTIREHRCFEHIPKLLKEKNNWVAFTEDMSEVNKPKSGYPIDINKGIVKGAGASNKNSNTWIDFNTAVKVFEEAETKGQRTDLLSVAIALPGLEQGQCIYCIDLDAHGEAELSEKLVADFLSLSTYHERSIHGKGYHLFGICTGEELEQIKQYKSTKLQNDTEIEIFSQKHFVTVSGWLPEGETVPTEINNVTTELLELLDRYCKTKPTSTRTRKQGSQGKYNDFWNDMANTGKIYDLLKHCTPEAYTKYCQENGQGEKSSRDYWLNVGMALKYEGFNFDTFDYYSYEVDGQGYTGRKDVEKAWNSFNNDKDKSVTGAFIISVARAGGWKGVVYENTVTYTPLKASTPDNPLYDKKINKIALADRFRNTHKTYYVASYEGSNTVRRFIYNKGVYKQVSDNEMKGYLKNFVINSDKNALKMGAIEETFKDLATDIDKFTTDSKFNTNENTINFKNGILDITTMKMYPHSDKYLSTIQINSEYLGEQPTPVFDKFLEEFTDSDEERKEALLQFMGACMSNVSGGKFKKSLFMVGDGNTGKSVLRNLITDLVGVEYSSGAGLKDLEQRFGTTQLVNKRVYGSSDLGFLSVDELKIFKQVTGNDTINVEYKGKDGFNYVYKGFLWFGCNSMPKFGGDRGKWVYDRILIIPCNHTVEAEHRDKLLNDKLLKEAPGIIYKSLEALKRAISNNYQFTIPKCSEKLMAGYKVENSPYLQFYYEACKPRTPEKPLYDNIYTTATINKYMKEWVGENCAFRNPKLADFKAELEQNGISTEERVNNGKHYYNFTSINDIKG